MLPEMVKRPSPRPPPGRVPCPEELRNLSADAPRAAGSRRTVSLLIAMGALILAVAVIVGLWLPSRSLAPLERALRPAVAGDGP
jgi:hypothetical protein